MVNYLLIGRTFASCHHNVHLAISHPGWSSGARSTDIKYEGSQNPMEKGTAYLRVRTKTASGLEHKLVVSLNGAHKEFAGLRVL